MDYLYHYTNVETLALILANRTIRFNALNKMDDLQEQETADIRNAGQFCFVSCWTANGTEQIPMWRMYGSYEAGVRIRLRKFPFLEAENKADELERAIGQPVRDVSDGHPMKTLIPLAELFSKKFITNTMTQYSEFLYKVEYTSDTEKLYPQVINENGESITLQLGKLGIYKNEGWAFQDEWRYKMLMFPLDPANKDFTIEASQMVFKITQGSAILPFTYYDLALADDAFSEMEVMMSPKISAGNRLLVHDLIEKYNPSASIVDSAYWGLIN